MKKSYSGSDIEEAFSEVLKEDGLFACAAAKKYNLPTSTLHDHLHENLTRSEERKNCVWHIAGT